MPRKYTKITPEVVAKVKKYLADDRGFSQTETARLVGIGVNSVKKIVQGYYDQPVENKATQAADSEPRGDTTAVIPYEKMEHLLKCEMFVDELFDTALKSDKGEEELYFPRHRTHSMCERYFPEKTQDTLIRLAVNTF